MIRLLKKEDYKEVKELMRELYELHLVNRKDIYQVGDPFLEEQFEELFNNFPNLNFVYEENNKIVGLLFAKEKILGVSLPILKERKVYYIDDFIVNKAYQKKGIGKQLYNHLKEKALQSKIDSIELNVWAFNEEAIKFYKKIGMAPKTIIMEEKM